MACNNVQTIFDNECIGDSLVKINSNFGSLNTFTCNLSSNLSSRIAALQSSSSSLSSINSFFTGLNPSLTTNSWQKLPGGLIVQWGTSGNVAGDANITVTFPITFPAACLCATATVVTAGDTWTTINWFNATSISLARGFQAGGVNASGPVFFVALGH